MIGMNAFDEVRVVGSDWLHQRPGAFFKHVALQAKVDYFFCQSEENRRLVVIFLFRYRKKSQSIPFDKQQ